ncbi:MAG TPA: hypothetical protein DCF63_04000 [Planctomycetaceae bacterium]|nr:hypothetical protein [Planctomycetaceae bacterium]
MLFLSDCKQQATYTYRLLLEDLLAGKVAEYSGETGLLYKQLVSWLGQIIRQYPRVVWPELTDLRPLEPLAGEDLLKLQSLDLALSSGLENWQNLFLRSSSRILLETSGSSGKPKQIWHSMTTLTQGIRCSPRHRTSVWGLTYPVDHLAGMQVLFQALLNANPLVHLYRASTSDVHEAIDAFSITHLSCTPTFLRMLLADSIVHPTLQRLTSGGERLDTHSLSSLSRMFPGARLTNIYASTEVGALLVSHDDGFVIPEHLASKVRIVDGALWLHESLKVENRLESRQAAGPNDEMVAEAFWSTGDQVEVVSKSPLKIRFLSRCHEGFNVAGFRVDPVRLEAIARTHPQVADARFYGIPNSITEHLVACDLVATEGAVPLEAAQWQAWLRPQVDRHELPRIVRWVSKIDTTDSGKVRRN